MQKKFSYFSFNTTRIFLFICMIILSVISASTIIAVDQQKIDSLLRVAQTSNDDTIKADCFITISKEYRKVDPENALKYGNQALQICINKKDKSVLRKLAKAYNNIGVLYKNAGNTQMALSYYNKTIALASTITETEDIGIAYFMKGNIYLNENKLAACLSNHLKALQIRKKLGNDKDIAASYNSIGLFYRNMGDYKNSLTYYLNGIKMCEQEKLKNPKNIDNLDRLVNFYTNTGSLYDVLKDYKTAMEYQQKALALSEKTQNNEGLITAYNNIGTLFSIRYAELLNTNQYKSKDTSGMSFLFHQAKINYNSSLEIATKIEDILGMINANSNLATLEIYNKNYKAASILYEEVLKQSQQINDSKLITQTLINICIVHFKLKDYKKAITYGEQALQVAEQLDSKPLQKDALFSLKDAYKENGQMEEALKYMERYSDLKEFLLNDESKSALDKQSGMFSMAQQQMRAEYEAKEKARLVAEEQARTNNKRSMGIFAVIVFLMLAIFFSGSYVIPQKVLDLSIFLVFLLFFEFILVLLDPITGTYTKDNPIYKLIFNATLALVMSPIHEFLEHKLKAVMVKRKTFKDRIDDALNKIAEE